MKKKIKIRKTDKSKLRVDKNIKTELLHKISESHHLQDTTDFMRKEIYN